MSTFWERRSKDLMIPTLQFCCQRHVVSVVFFWGLTAPKTFGRWKGTAWGRCWCLGLSWGCCNWALGHKRCLEKKGGDILWWSTKRRAKTTLSVKGSTFISPYWKLVSTWLDRDGTIVVRIMWFCVSFWSKVVPFHFARSGIGSIRNCRWFCVFVLCW